MVIIESKSSLTAEELVSGFQLILNESRKDCFKRFKLHVGEKISTEVFNEAFSIIRSVKKQIPVAYYENGELKVIYTTAEYEN